MFTFRHARWSERHVTGAVPTITRGWYAPVSMISAAARSFLRSGFDLPVESRPQDGHPRTLLSAANESVVDWTTHIALIPRHIAHQCLAPWIGTDALGSLNIGRPPGVVFLLLPEIWVGRFSIRWWSSCPRSSRHRFVALRWRSRVRLRVSGLATCHRLGCRT